MFKVMGKKIMTILRSKSLPKIDGIQKRPGSFEYPKYMFKVMGKKI